MSQNELFSQETPEPQKRIEELTRQLLDLQHQYYVTGESQVSDAVYDKLSLELEQLESAHPQWKSPNSPTTRIGSDLSTDFAEVRHTVPVMSLDKSYTSAELSLWVEKTRKAGPSDLVFTLEEKMDGLSIVCYYEDGVLVRALTRGNGEVGNDVTPNVRTIRTVPLQLKEKVTVAVRGEVFLPRSRFDAINALLPVAYKNPRNLAAGTLRRVKSTEVASVPLEVYFYEGFFTPPKSSHLEALADLKSLGFPLNPHLTVLASGGKVSEKQKTWAGVLGAPIVDFNEISNLTRKAADQRSALDWEIDGLVAKIDLLDLREELGYTGHHPRWAMAFKFESPQGITMVKAIDVQVGRTGRVTPVARVEPVNLGGSTIENVTLHNQSYIDGLELGIGDQVVVSRRGDVIPAVEQVLEKTSISTWTFPQSCPSCDTELVVDGAHHFCPNNQCPDQVRGLLEFFAAKDQMDIVNMGPETLKVLIEEGAKEPADLFRFNYDSLLNREGFGEKKVALIKEALEVAKKRPFATVLASIGVPEFGKKAVELLLENGYDTMDKIFEVIKTPETLLAIHGFGEKTLQTMQEELNSPSTRARIESLAEVGLAMAAEADTGPRSEAWKGQIWCVTGSFQGFNPRSLAEEQIKRRGARVTSSVSSNTTHLLAGPGAGSKLEKAQSLGISVVDEVTFVTLLAAAPI